MEKTYSYILHQEEQIIWNGTIFLYNLVYTDICIMCLDSKLNRRWQNVFTPLLIMKEKILCLSQIMSNIVCQYYRFLKMQKSLLCHSLEKLKTVYVLVLIRHPCVFPHSFLVSHHLISGHLDVLIFHLKNRKQNILYFFKNKNLFKTYQPRRICSAFCWAVQCSMCSECVWNQEKKWSEFVLSVY